MHIKHYILNNYPIFQGRLFIIILSIVTYLCTLIPLLTLSDDVGFLIKNVAFIIFIPIIVYLMRLNYNGTKPIIAFIIISIGSIVYMNLISKPVSLEAHTLPIIFMPLFFWSLAGLAYLGKNINDTVERISFLKFFADIFVLTALLMLACGLLIIVSVLLFSLSNITIDELNAPKYILPLIMLIPLLATYITVIKPDIVKSTTPLVAKICAPAALIVLIIYLISIAVNGISPKIDRSILIIVNIILVLVMAIILFSLIGDNAKESYSMKKWWRIILASLAIASIAINIIALYAIIYRLASMGATQNRIAVVGSNLIILTNIVWIFIDLIRRPNQATKSIALFLPIYSLWFFIVTFVVPALFA